MTSIELKALRLHGLTNHPWKQKMVARLMSKVRRDIGENDWTLLQNKLIEAKQEKNDEIWSKAVSHYYEKISKIEAEDAIAAEEKKQILAKEKKIAEIEKKRMELLKNKITDNVSRIRPNSPIVRRRKMD